MRKLGPFARRSAGRDAHRSWYDHYIQSPEWWARRRQWEEFEQLRLDGRPIMCAGGCGKQWNASSGDLHHCDYDRLGQELHEDLWGMCRGCHTALHELLASTRSWRKLPRRVANEHAVARLRSERDPATKREQRRKAVESLGDWL